jgi:hypothetical protein
MPEVEPALEGAIMALLLRLLFGFDVSMPLALLAGIGSRLAAAWLGPGFVAPDWWMAELVVSGATTMAILGCLQVVRAHRF